MAVVAVARQGRGVTATERCPASSCLMPAAAAAAAAAAAVAAAAAAGSCA